MKVPSKFVMAAFAICFLGFAGSSLAVPLTMTNMGPAPTGGSTIYRGDFASIGGLTSISSITVVDDGTTFGGADGIFSGFDLDAVFIDGDGDLTTTGDQHFASSYAFSAGSTRPTSNTVMLPNAAHPGPTFGSIDSSTIDHATATLNLLDSIAVANVNSGDGFLTLGDGGVLDAFFDPSVAVGASLFLVTGEVGGQAGELIEVSVLVNEPQVGVPAPATLALLGIGLAGFGYSRSGRNSN